MELPHGLHRATPAELKARIEAERRERPFLLYRDGDGAQRHPRPRRRPRAPDDRPQRRANDVALTWDAEVSRLHATIEHVGDEWTLVDDGRSHNGSFVDGARVHGRRRLRDGDAIAVGRTAIVFRSPTGRESLQTATSQQRARRRSSARRSAASSSRSAGPTRTTPTRIPASNRQIADELVLGVETSRRTCARCSTPSSSATCPSTTSAPRSRSARSRRGLISPQDLARLTPRQRTR